jgi:hypothetical protein
VGRDAEFERLRGGLDRAIAGDARLRTRLDRIRDRTGRRRRPELIRLADDLGLTR